MKTITEDYKILQQKLHENPNYGVASTHFAPIVSEIIKAFKINTLSDYGAGKKRLYESLEKLNNLPKDYFPYDPAFPKYGEPKPINNLGLYFTAQKRFIKFHFIYVKTRPNFVLLPLPFIIKFEIKLSE